MNLIYPRPKVFSNPDKDFAPEELSAILQKHDAELTDTDFCTFFKVRCVPEPIRNVPISFP